MRTARSIYLSFPITGYDLAERAEFARSKVSELQEIFGECEVYNPMENYNPEDEKEYEWYMAEDLYRLPNYDTICFCEGWKNSKGCKMEYYMALNCGLKRMTLDNSGRVCFNPEKIKL